MPRAERQVPNVYFGRPGSLVTLPWPRGDEERSYDRLTYDFVTGSGAHQVSTLLEGSRPFSIKWDALHYDNFAKIEQYRTGMMGVGPWTYIDPASTNLVPANVASATSLANSTRHFSGITALADNGVLSSQADPTYIHRTGASRSLRWRWNVTASTNPQIYPTPPYRSWYGIPAVVGLPYIWSSWMRADAIVDSSITASMRLHWLDAAGAELSQNSTGNLTVTGTWQRLSVTATAPANTAYVKSSWIATGSSITTGASLYIDEPLLEQDSVLNDWAPGTGLRPVEIVDLTESVPFSVRMRQNVQLQLRELAR
jgi:hypothetical protein